MSQWDILASMSAETELDPLVTTPEATELLGYKNTTSVARLVYEHKLVPARKLPGKNGAYLFNRSDIEALRRARADRAAS